MQLEATHRPGIVPGADDVALSPRLHNPDLAPTQAEGRTWGRYSIFALWTNDVHNIANYSFAIGLFALGCGGMAGLDRQIEECTGVPVVDGVSAAVALAESLVRLKLKTSKVRTYAPPRPKRIVGWPDTFAQ